MRFICSRYAAVFSITMAIQLAFWLCVFFAPLLLVNSHWAVIASGVGTFALASAAYMVAMVIGGFIMRLASWVSAEQKHALMVYTNILLLIVKRDVNDPVDFFTVAFAVVGSFFIGIVLFSYLLADFSVRRACRIDA